MNISKYIVSSIAAVSVVGAITFAYAQSAPDASTGPITVPPPQSQTATPVEITPSPQLAPAPAATAPAPAATPMQATTPTAPMPDSTINSTATPPPSDAGAMPTERAAQVDRN